MWKQKMHFVAVMLTGNADNYNYTILFLATHALTPFVSLCLSVAFCHFDQL